MTTRIYVKRTPIQQNLARGRAFRPPIRVDRNGNQEDCFEAQIMGPSRIVFSLDDSCGGSHVWLETDSKVVTVPSP